MATITSCQGNTGGRLVAFTSPQAVPLALSLAYTELVSNGQNNLLTYQQVPVQLGVVTAVRAGQSVIAQFQRSLDGAIYVTPFGDNVGEVVISFIVNRACNTVDGENQFDAISHYLEHRLLPRRRIGNTITGKPLVPAVIGIGSATLRGFLTALNTEGAAGAIPMYHASLTFRAWPS